MFCFAAILAGMCPQMQTTYMRWGCLTQVADVSRGCRSSDLCPTRPSDVAPRSHDATRKVIPPSAADRRRRKLEPCWPPRPEDCTTKRASADQRTSNTHKQHTLRRCHSSRQCACASRWVAPKTVWTEPCTRSKAWFTWPPVVARSTSIRPCTREGAKRVQCHGWLAEGACASHPRNRSSKPVVP